MIGTEVTGEMLEQARQLGLPAGCTIVLTDGIRIPLADASVDMVWCCAVLRYSLLVAEPVCGAIAREMYRVLKPGGLVINLEMYVDCPPETFCRPFEDAGFATRDVRILQRHDSRIECIVQQYAPRVAISIGGTVSAALRFHLDRANRAVPGLRDYLFVWSKRAGPTL